MNRSLASRRCATAALGLLALQGCSLQTAQDTAERERLSAMLEQCRTDVAEAEQTRIARDERLTAELEGLREALAGLGERFSACEAEPPAAEVVAEAAATISEPAIVEEEPQKLVVGRRENVWVEDLQLALPARIDTGAETASLDARNITPFERDGKAWVRFDIRHPQSDEMLSLERRQVREALVIQASSDEPERRPVIRLGIQLGSVRQLAEFTLSDRSHLDYQMLVGRNILRDVMLVDVSAVNLVPLPAQPQGDSE
jgi:hypothetical protein